jgi:ergothioneine biosynthesis protein EgtB
LSVAARSLADVLRDELAACWARSDLVLRCVRDDAILERPIALRHPFVFYVGHLPAFAWNQVARGVLRKPSIHHDFERLFERGIDPADAAEAARTSRSAWPALAEVRAYRDVVRAALPDLIDEVLALPADDPLADRGRVVRLVIEHERMHEETLLYMVQELDHARKRPPDGSQPATGASPGRAREVAVPAGGTTLGVDFEAVDFAWDNELPATPVDVPAFSIDALPVTNEAYRDFVDAGGYRRDDLWSPEGAAWRREAGLAHPRAWRRDGDRWSVRGVFSDVPFEDARGWPAQVSFAEADAYARWRGRRLPAEAELHRAAHGTASGADRPYPWGSGPPTPAVANVGFARWSPEPVGLRPAGASAFGVEETVGNGWEWTSSPFAPLPGFSAWARTYPGYSADFFDGRHRVLLGGSWATDLSLLRPSFRNWYQPHYPFPFSKFRTVAV